MKKLKLPIGIQSFSEIREGGYYYVDKTYFMHQLIEQGKYYFLSRPRRFGKSLFVDTLHCLFESKKSLFKGLYIEKKWDWNTTHPVVRLSFGDGVAQSRQALDNRITQQLSDNRKRLGLSDNSAIDIPGNFRNLIQEAKSKHGHNVVVLIDEYDKPILDNLHNNQVSTANREGLKNLYSVIKDADEFIKFTLLTGVSKFSKVSLFSGLNNLIDITLDKPYSDICGYTEQDLDTVFSEELQDLDRNQIRQWYNGYNWLGERVHNPFDILLLFRNRQFKPYWFESATPTFLVNFLKEREINSPQLAEIITEYELLGRFDVDDIGVEALLFQTGYLTIKEALEPIPGIWSYRLTYPNLEVENSLNKALLISRGISGTTLSQTRILIIKCLQGKNFTELEKLLKSLYASIPHDWYRNNSISDYEGHYASIFYSHFAALGLHVMVEDASINGKVDMAFKFNNTIFLFEFKVVEDQATGHAIKQITTKNYAEKYKGSAEKIYGIGVEFSKKQRQIIKFDWLEL